MGRPRRDPGAWPQEPARQGKALHCTGKFIPNLQRRQSASFLFQGLSYIIALHVLAEFLWRIFYPLPQLVNAIYKQHVKEVVHLCVGCHMDHVEELA